MVGVIRSRLSLAICVCAVALSIPVVATARGPGGGGGSGGSSYKSGSKKADGCGMSGNLPEFDYPKTSKHKHQPYAEYDGTISTPGGQPFPNTQNWSIVVDHCKKTPKIAEVVGDFPGYYCGSTEVYESETGKEYAGTHEKEPVISHNTFSFSGGYWANAMTYTVSGTIAGKLKIPKRGRAKGNSTITGTVVPAECPSLSFPFKLKFTKSWSSLIRGGGY